MVNFSKTEYPFRIERPSRARIAKYMLRPYHSKAGPAAKGRITSSGAHQR
jgi:hypothetical protein